MTNPTESTNEPVQPELRFQYGVIAWVGLPLSHIVLMIVDWQLRDDQNPMIGGIPKITELFQLFSIFAFFVCFILALPPKWALWTRMLVSIAVTLAVTVAMFFGWLAYIVGNGIDTL